MTVSPTLAISNTAGRLWDAIVIGAGPAGATAALALAREGASTLLIDRQRYPRVKVCGGCLNGRALAALSSLGLDDILPRSQATELRQFIVQAGKRRVALDLHCGVAIDRATFDAEIVRAAIQAGAKFLPETSAIVCRSGKPGTPWRTVELNHRGQIGLQVDARVILVADGLGHPSLRKTEGFHCRVAPTARVGLGLVVCDSSGAYSAGAIHMGISRTGYVGLVRTANGCLNIAAAVDPQALKVARTPATIINGILRDARMSELPATAVQAGQGTLPLTQSTSCLAAERVFVLGDAAGYVEPFTGEGMGWAIESAISVVPYAIRSVRCWDEQFAKEWNVAQRQRIFRRQIACRILSLLLRRPSAVELVLGALSVMPVLAKPFVRRIHVGRAKLNVMLP